MRESTFQFPIPLDLLQQFKECARKKDMPAAQLLRQLIKELLKREVPNVGL